MPTTAPFPLDSPTSVAVIGGHADVGVLSGGGSSQVAPAGTVREEGRTVADIFRIPRTYHPPSPLKALRAALPDAAISYLDGGDLSGAAGAASEADLAIVFVEQWTAEGHDVPDLGFPGAKTSSSRRWRRRTPARWSWWSPADPS